MLACSTPSYTELDFLSTSVSESSARSLYLLNAIEQTIDNLQWISSHAQADARLASNDTERLSKCERHKAIDPDDKIRADLENAQNVLEELHGALTSKQLVAKKSHELREDDGVVEAYHDAIQSVSTLHEEIEGLRWAIMEHDADLDPSTSKAFDDVEDMFTQLEP